MGDHVWLENGRKADGSPERRRYCIMAMKCKNKQSNSCALRIVFEDVFEDEVEDLGWVGEHLLQFRPGE